MVQTKFDKGKLAIVLHAHLPYVRSSKPGSLEEDWFFQALMECYLPLIKVLQDSSSSEKEDPKITLSLSPTLLSLLDDNELKEKFPNWLRLRLELLNDIPKTYSAPTEKLAEKIRNQLSQWEIHQGNLINSFATLQKDGVIDLLTCAATHGYLPLLRENPEAIRGQLRTAVREHFRLIGTNPLGIWLPECAYYEGLDELMIEAGLRYAVLDGHGILHASPRPRYGLYSPICSKKGVAFFGRDTNSTLPVWSSRHGYPGHSEYREFHRDLGWDLQADKLNQIGINEPRPLGIKLYKVTNKNTSLENKDIYEPKKAEAIVKVHAKKYLQGRKDQLNKLHKTMGIEPLLVAPFDAELFGHWWFEGPIFISEIFKQAKEQNIELTSLKEHLTNNPRLQLCDPSPSSWGQGGYHHYWTNETNAWIIPEWNKASRAMIRICSKGFTQDSDIKILQQAARELLLSQSSDWSFIIKAGTTTKLAKERINRHLNRFWSLLNLIEGNENISEEKLFNIEKEDSLFPLVQPKDWSKN
tara:strand:- start:833 stop:2410 length:1578 start_codon:yes stop_codon:yes gene_type:complete